MKAGRGRRQQGEQKSRVIGNEGKGQVAPRLTEEQVGVGQQRAPGHQLPQGAEQHQGQGESQAGPDAIHQGRQGRLSRREGLGAADDRAVGHDQGDEDAQHHVELAPVGAHQQLRRGHRGGDNEDEGRDADFRSQQAAGQGNGQVRDRQHTRGGEAQAERIGHGAGDRQQGTQSEQHHQPGVLAPETVLEHFDEGRRGAGAGRA